MTNNIRFLLISIVIIFIVGCKKDNPAGSPSGRDTPLTEDSVLSPSARTFLNKLKALADAGKTLTGHQATTIAGVGWRLWQQPDHSDFLAVSGKFPALYGWELAHPPNDPGNTYDAVSYQTTIQEALKAYYRGGVNTFSIHPYRLDNNGNSWDNTPGYLARLLPDGDLHPQYKAVLDRYITVLRTLKDSSGMQIPFIFRPYHEANHSWFWWGNTACTDTDFKSFFRFTVLYMRSNGLNNMLVCYAPGYFGDTNTYYARYPGDDVVDILGFDGYYGNNNGHGTDWNTLQNHLTILKQIATSKGKPAAWAETGERVITANDYFSQLDQTIRASGLQPAYLMFWANYHAGEFYIPYEAMNAPALKTDFIRFLDKTTYLTAGAYSSLYD